MLIYKTRNRHDEPSPTHDRSASLFSRRKTHPVRKYIGAWLMVFLLPGLLPAQTAQNGAVAGRVFNPATNQYVGNAEIRIRTGPFDRTVTSDDYGNYRLAGVPTGEATVSINYTGYYTQSATLTVAAGQTITHDFDLISTQQRAPASSAKSGDVVVLEAFSVSAEREGNAKAIMEQRASMNFKNVIASDVFGDVAEGNVGEFLKFMPGINLEYVEADTRAVRIRGLNPKYAAVTMDGDRMASAGSSNLGASRQFEFEQVSINSVETIEVNKTQTADMDADAVAGSINLKSRSAFSQKGRRITAQLNATANSYEMTFDKTAGPRDDYTRKIRGGGILQYSESYFNNRLGAVLVLSYSDMYNEQYRLVNYFDYNPVPDAMFGATLRPGTANQSPATISRVTYKDGPKFTERSAASLNLDYKLTRNTIVSFRSSYAGFTASVSNAQVQLLIPRANQEPGSDIYNIVARNYDVRNRQLNPNSPANVNTSFYMDSSLLDKHGSTSTFSGQIQYKRDSFRADASLSYSRATNHYDDLDGVDGGSFRSASFRLNQGMGFELSRGNQRNPAWIIRQNAGADIYDLSNYRATNANTYNLTSQPKDSDDKRYSVQANATWTPRSSLPIVIRAGIKAREEIYNLTNLSYGWRYLGPTRAVMDAAPPVSSFIFKPELGGNLFTDRPMPYPDRSALAAQFKEHPEYFLANPRDAVSDYNVNSKRYVREKINAAYVRADLRFNKFLMQGGIRMESTEEIYKVFENSIGQKMQNRYDDVFLSVSAKYRFTPNLMLLAGYGQGLQRPDFGNLTGVISTDDENMTFSMPNQNLQPEYSKNYNLMLEYYFEPVGVIRASVFMLDVKNIQYNSSNVEGEPFGLPGYVGKTTLNGPQLKTTGLELEYSQELSFLIKGLSIFANYTHVKADADTVYDNFGNPAQDSEIMAGSLSPNVISGGLAYSYRWLGLSLRAVWTDETYSGTGTITYNGVTNVQYRRYKNTRFMMDASVTIKFTPRLTLSLNGRNILDEPSTWYENAPYTVKTPDRMYQYERYGVTWTAVLKATF